MVPLQDPAGGPNFYPCADGSTARYYINIDNRGAVHYPNSDADGSLLYANGLANSLNDATLLFKQTTASRGSSGVPRSRS